jgi:hypothetical protein
MLLTFFIQMVITCWLFLFTLRIILGVFPRREDKVEIMRSGVIYIYNPIHINFLIPVM